MINTNQHLVIAQELATISDDEDLVLFAGIMDLFVRNNDNHVIREDVEDLMDNRWQMRSHARLLERGNHPLQQAGLVEQTDCNGQVEADAWKMTDAATKNRLLTNKKAVCQMTHRLYFIRPKTTKNDPQNLPQI